MWISLSFVKAFFPLNLTQCAPTVIECCFPFIYEHAYTFTVYVIENIKLNGKLVVFWTLLLMFVLLSYTLFFPSLPGERGYSNIDLSEYSCLFFFGSCGAVCRLYMPID